MNATTPVALYNLSPAAWLLAGGALVAAVPLLWSLWRTRGQGASARVHALTLLTLFLTFDLVLFGAFTRLTDSGLGCPDWPGCYGHASPVGAHAHIAAEQAAMPSGPVTLPKAWVEMVHRYLASGVGALIVVLALWRTALWRRRAALPSLSPSGSAPQHPALAWFTLLWVIAQGAFGALTVTMKLLPAIVTLHLLGGLGLLALLTVQVARGSNRPHRAWSPNLRRALGMVGALLLVQITLGAWVSTNYAVLACVDFPTCQGRWWPDLNASGFEVWRPLGHTAAGAPLPFEALTTIHFIHRLGALFLLPALWALAWALRAVAPRHAKAFAWLGAWQLLTGLSNVVLGWPLLAAVAHTGGAAALTMVWAHAAVRARGAVGFGAANN